MEIWVLLQPILAPGHVKPKDRRSLNRIAQDLFAHAKSLGPTRQGGDDATAEIVD
jgi:hypothetical protein